MRGALLLLLAATASAQDTRGFVNPNLVNRNFFSTELKAKAAEKPILLDSPPMGPCAIPLLEVVLEHQNLDSKMVIVPRGKFVDEKMILPTIPVCGKR